MKKAEDYLLSAISEIETNWKDTTTHKVPNVFKGHISSFGASIVLSGLIPTLAFFSKDKRKMVLEALQNLLGDKELLTTAATYKKEEKYANLRKLEKDIMQAAIALKLALRTFEMDNSNLTEND